MNNCNLTLLNTRTIFTLLIVSFNVVIINAAGWQRHEAPSPVWQIEPKVENGIQTGLLLGCQDNHVYSISNSGEIEWSFDTKGLPSQIISADLDGDGKSEVIVATHDDAGTILILSNSGTLLHSFAHGMPFSAIGISTTRQIRIFGATYDGVVYFFDKNLNLVNKNTYTKPNAWYQALKVGDLTGNGQDEVVALMWDGNISIFNSDLILLKRERIGDSGKRGDLFLVDINGDSKKEIMIISAGMVNNNHTLEFKNGELNTLWTFSNMRTTASLTIIDDFLPTAGWDVLCYDPFVFGSNVYVHGLSASGLTQRNKKEIKRDRMHMPLCVNLSADKKTIIAGSVGTRDNSFYSISSSAFQSERYPLLPEVNYTIPALNTLANGVQSTSAQKVAGEKPYVLCIRGYVNQYNLGNMDGWAATIREFEALAPHVKVVIEFPVDTKTKMTHKELMDFTDMLERERIPFTYEMSSGSSPSNITIAQMREVLIRAPEMCYGFATTENARYARNPNDPWKKIFFPMVLEVAQLCKEFGKTINVQENGSGWQVYVGDPDVISQWFAPELKGTVIPIVRNNSNGAYLAYNALLGLEAAGFSDGWGVSIQDWMWGDQGKHQIMGLLPRELMTRSNMMAAAMGARYFQFESGGYAMEDMVRITSKPTAPIGLQEDGVFFQYLRKGVFQGYHSSDLKNLSTHAVGLEYNDNLWQQIQNQWFLGMWDFNANSDLNSGVLGQHTALQPLPEKNIYKHLYDVKCNKTNNFKTPYGLIPIVPSPYPPREDGINFQMIQTDRHVFLGQDVKYQNTNLLKSTFEEAAQSHPFRTDDAFLAAYSHDDGYLIYLIGTEYFAYDDGNVTVNIHNDVEMKTAVDYVTGEEFKIQGNTFNVSIPGGVIRTLYIPTGINVGTDELVSNTSWISLRPSQRPGHISLVLHEEKTANLELISLDGKVIDCFEIRQGTNDLYSRSTISGLVLLRVRFGQKVQLHKYVIN